MTLVAFIISALIGTTFAALTRSHPLSIVSGTIVGTALTPLVIAAIAFFRR